MKREVKGTCGHLGNGGGIESVVFEYGFVRRERTIRGPPNRKPRPVPLNLNAGND